MRLFLLALQFLTVIPVPGSHHRRPDDFGRSMLFFPLVGALLGGIVALVDHLLATVIPLPLRSGIDLASLVILTGALHLDGVADLFDAIGSRGDRETFLAVMKDSRIGAMGVAALILLLLLDFCGIASLTEPLRTPSLILVPMAGRCAMTAAAAGAPAARTDGLGTLFVAGATPRLFLLSFLSTLAAGYLLCGPAGVGAVVVAVSFAALLRYHLCRRIGGVTGDVIGAAGELSQLMALIILVAAG